jgi:hypothetical protein
LTEQAWLMVPDPASVPFRRDHPERAQIGVKLSRTPIRRPFDLGPAALPGHRITECFVK